MNELDLLMTATSLPSAADTYFAAVSLGQLPVKATEFIRPSRNDLSWLIEQVDERQLFVRMLNEGNLLDIAAELRAESETFGQAQPYRRWQIVAQAVLASQTSNTFHATRIALFNPAGTNAPIQHLIDQGKDSLVKQQGTPGGIDIDNISWDAVSFKLPPTVSELLCQMNPALSGSLSVADFAVIDQMGDVCLQAVVEKCAEFRAQTQTLADEFISDCSMYLEQSIGGFDDHQRAIRVQQMNKNLLIKYVHDMAGLFSTGNIPGVIPPSKIYACHDIISSYELRGAIQQLSEEQGNAPAELLSNPNVRAQASALAGKDSQKINTLESAGQRASLINKRNVDNGYRRVMATMKEKYMVPMSELGNKLSGGSNKLSDQVDMAARDGVVQLSEEQTQSLAQNLSLLLACLRIRCDAVQKALFELVPDEDFDHMEIVKELSQQTTVDLRDNIYRTAETLQKAYARGHNVAMTQDRSLPKELQDLISYTIQGRIRMAIKAVRLFDDDLNEGGEQFSNLIVAATHVATFLCRLKTETNERYTKKLALIRGSTTV